LRINANNTIPVSKLSYNHKEDDIQKDLDRDYLRNLDPERADAYTANNNNNNNNNN